eukprot:112968-Chlamydomonas_euryale.AAC.1
MRSHRPHRRPCSWCARSTRLRQHGACKRSVVVGLWEIQRNSNRNSGVRRGYTRSTRLDQRFSDQLSHIPSVNVCGRGALTPGCVSTAPAH